MFCTPTSLCLIFNAHIIIIFPHRVKGKERKNSNVCNYFGNLRLTPPPPPPPVRILNRDKLFLSLKGNYESMPFARRNGAEPFFPFMTIT